MRHKSFFEKNKFVIENRGISKLYIVSRKEIDSEIKNNVQIIDIEEFNQAEYDLNLSAKFASKNTNGSLKIGDASRGLSYIPQATKDAANYFK